MFDYQLSEITMLQNE